jgi:SagB-type dehydrogenase family enzyme
VSLEEAINNRISRRRFLTRELTKEQLSQLLWVTQGLTSGHTRSVPSAGATYPLEIFVVIGEESVEGISGGIYWYRYNNHLLDLHKQGDWRKELGRACWGQDFISTAPVDIAIAAEFERTTARYGRRGEQYVYMEVGHVGQNIYLEAEALGLGTVAIGAFSDGDVKEVLGLQKELEPLYIMPVGYAK